LDIGQGVCAGVGMKARFSIRQWAHRWMWSRTFVVAVLGVVAVAATDSFGQGVPASSPNASTGWYDFAQVALVPMSDGPARQTLGGLTYQAKGTLKEAFDFHKRDLLGNHWKELPGGYESDQYCSAAYDRDGYKISLTVFANGDEGEASVTMVQHGNVDLASIPRTADMVSTFAGPVSAMYTGTQPLAASKEANRKLIEEAGWEPYGDAGDSFFFRRGQNRLTVFFGSPANDPNATVVQYSVDVMSVEIPALAGAKRVQYSDYPTQLSIDVDVPMDELFAKYREKLGALGWTATTENSFKVDFQENLIFSHPSKALLTIEAHRIDDVTRALLRVQSAAEVEQEKQAFEEEMAKRKQEAAMRDKPSLVPLSVRIPKGAKGVKSETSAIKFTMEPSKGKLLAEAWQKIFEKDGWKTETASLESVAGVLLMVKEKMSLTISYTDTGILPTEISIDGVGVELKRE
jgi:hypothetical protein